MESRACKDYKISVLSAAEEDCTILMRPISAADQPPLHIHISVKVLNPRFANRTDTVVLGDVFFHHLQLSHLCKCRAFSFPEGGTSDLEIDLDLSLNTPTYALIDLSEQHLKFNV